MPVNQKGANGLIAEYKAAAVLNEELAAKGFSVVSSQAVLEANLKSAIDRVGNELTALQVERALKQGVAIADYLLEKMVSHPAAIGIREFELDHRQDKIAISTVGNNTNSGDPTDLIIQVFRNEVEVSVPISLKAYRGPESSLGSKSARASLCRMFLSQESITDAEFFEFFGPLGVEFMAELSKFKTASKDFYASPAGTEFVDKYELRKGTRKVNNPLRRKEVGGFFQMQHGYKPEHKFAQLYVEMFNLGLSQVDTTGLESEKFVAALRFILGNPEMLVIDVIADDSGKILDIHNSLDHPVYLAFNEVLNPGVELELTLKPRSSIIKVVLRNSSSAFNNLSLAIWKDATIQYKLNAGKKK
jgi:hypothetical protein